MTAETKDYIFTFGHGQTHFGKYVIINGTFVSARNEMFKRFDRAWCMQYDSKEQAGVERWGLAELK